MQIVGEVVEVRHQVEVAHEPEVDRPVVAHDRDAECLIRGEGDHREEALELAAHHVEGNCGPGTFVTTRLNMRWRATTRAAWLMMFGGAKPVSSVSTCAPTACPPDLRWLM